MSVSIVAGSRKQGVKYRKAVSRSGFHAGTASVRQSDPANRLLPASSQPPTISTQPIITLGRRITTYGLSRSHPLLLIALFRLCPPPPPRPSQLSFIFPFFSPASFASQARGCLLVYHPLLAWLFLLNSHPAALVYNLCFRLINILDLH
ncbi:uncharacterized protein P174DRAFT_3539 [Aspergillus novofumigatus IBT 16806]|uniref:Uncharacterized protein n=1 Tax=Aspergillus novofumigatus (strain IBT 16806) TaxID=1392255 RepID=A0A2I1CKC9_ASPN1|nr:uncharacterized protein P174DRAFT_3539 [Aspergillus novofumigatus IBT 16806]PKX98082.1 hypothetical protein P174DRAFT_3539 [Aspergillus novofumigatus IBT 16806]